MKKTGIVTLNGYFNFGNRLQNYALQEAIKKTGKNVETIIVPDNPNIHNKSLFDKLKGKSLSELFLIFQSKFDGKLDNEREKVFVDFTKNNIKEVKYNFDKANIPTTFKDDFDHFVTGSDQVWNPNYIKDPSFYFLDFADEHQRISYAASFGISSIPFDYKQQYSELISGMNRLSVREVRGREIVSELSTKEAQVYVDPTLLLSKNEWLEISKPAISKPNNKFILTYFLGGIPKKDKKRIEYIAEKNNLEIINMADRKDRENYKNVGPSEFLDYINSCEIFCTDSFHGVVFSIIFQKAFIVYPRQGSSDMFSRIDTILDKFKLTNRKSTNVDFDNPLSINFADSSEVINKEQEKSYDYLRQSLKISL